MVTDLTCMHLSHMSGTASLAGMPAKAWPVSTVAAGINLLQQGLWKLCAFQQMVDLMSAVVSI